MKKCNKCSDIKELSEFHNDRTKSDGKYPVCRLCRSPKADKTTVFSVVRTTEGNKYCRPCDSEKPLSAFHKGSHSCKICRLANPTKTKDPEKIVKQRETLNRKRREDPATIEKNREYKRMYYSINKTEINVRERERINDNLSVKIATQLRKRTGEALRHKSKVGSAVRDLGCSIEFLIEHLTSQFTEGMTWENYGLKGWHIDHIKPLSKFDLTDPEQFKTAAHYTNLQPLWAWDNLSKGCK